MEDNPKHPLDWNAKLVKFFFDNGRLVWLIIIGLVIGGIFSVLSSKREGFPAVSIKTVAVQTIYPGATSTQVESKVTRPLESSVKDAKGMKDFSSVSSNSFSQIIVNFDESVSIDQAVQDVQNKISGAKGELPKEAESPKVITFTTGGPSFYFGVTGEGDIAKIRAQAEKLAEEIENVDGVKKAETFTEEKRINIKFDLAKIKSKGVQLAGINQIIQASNVNYPTGNLQIGGKEQSSISLGAFKTVDEIANITVGADPKTFQPIKLKDIAQITKGSASTKNIERIGYTKDGNLIAAPSSMVTISLTDDADIIKTKDKIFEEIDKLKEENKIDKSTTLVSLYDQAIQTETQISEIVSGAIGKKSNLWLLGGLQLLFLAMLLLVNWRSAFVAALAIPFSFAFTFIALKLTGTELNTLVQFSFVLVLGLIVDPAIVMVEAIQRYRDLNRGPREAVIESGRRYGASLFMAVLTSLLVFIPFGVVSGYFGEIIKYIPLTVVPALIASYIVPIALLPYLSRKILHKEHGDKTKVEDESEDLSRAARFVMRTNSWILAKTWREVVVFVGAFILVIASMAIIGLGKIQMVQFANPEDNTMIQTQAVYAKGLSQADRDKAASGFEKVLLKEKGIREYFYIQESTNGFTMFINLKDKKERTEIDRSKEILKRIKDGSKSLTSLTDIVTSEMAAGPPTENYQILTQLATNNLEALEKASKEIGKHISTLPHVVKVDDGFTNKKDPEIQIRLNRSKVEANGLSSYEVGSQIKALLDELQIGKFEDANGDSLEIFIMSTKKPTSIAEINNLVLANRSGKFVTVGDVAEIKEGQGVGTIERYNGARFGTIKTRVDEDKNVAAVQKEVNNYLTDAKLKSLGIDSKLNKGQLGDITKSFTDLGIAMIIAILLTYVFLVLQFKSFSLPGIMLFTIPLSLIGVFPAIWFTTGQLGFLELLGVTILIGIVENVAIFLIDYANQLIKEKDMTAREAIIQASGVRFRPIILTKVVALGGLLPLAIESDFWRGLSVVIIAGIGLSGFFSLLVIPILFVWLSSIRMKIHKGKIA